MEETLIQAVVQGTGLSENRAKKIIRDWIVESGRTPGKLSIEDYRAFLVEMLQSIFHNAAEGENPYLGVSAKSSLS